MHHNICCCSSFVQCLWAAVQKNNISCCTLKHGVSAQDWCFSPMAALNKLVKKPNRAATGIWRATETALWSRESTWIQREKCDDAGPGRCLITVCFQPAAKEGSFCLVTGVDYQAWLGASFLRNSACCWDILVQDFLPADLLVGIAVLRACARLCGCRAGICLNPRGGCNQCASGFAVSALQEPHFLSRLSPCYPSSSLWLDILPSLITEVLGGLLLPSLAKGKILLLSLQLLSGQAPGFNRSQLLSALTVQKAGLFILPSDGCPGQLGWLTFLTLLRAQMVSLDKMPNWEQAKIRADCHALCRLMQSLPWRTHISGNGGV